MNNHFEFICYHQEISHNDKAETETHFLNYITIPIPLKFTISLFIKNITKIQPAKHHNIFLWTLVNFQIASSKQYLTELAYLKTFSI